MEYKDQLKEAERILDKINAVRQPDGEVQKRLDELELFVAYLTVFSLIGWVILVIYIVWSFIR